MALILGHRGHSAAHLENSMEAFRASLAAGMDGFELDVQPTRDGHCVILHDDDLERTAQLAGILRMMNYRDLPLLKNAESLPLLSEALALPASLINVELKGAPGWEIALKDVRRARSMKRVLFSSFEHDEVIALSVASPRARCGLIWTIEQAMALTQDDISAFPARFMLGVPMSAIQARPGFWAVYSKRIVLWDIQRASEAGVLPFEPAIVVADGL